MTSPGGKAVARVSVRVVPDTSGFDDDLRRELNGKEIKLPVGFDLDVDQLRRDLAAVSLDEISIRATLDRDQLDAELAALRSETRSIDVETQVDRDALRRQLAATGDGADVKLNVGIDDASLRSAQARVAAAVAVTTATAVPAQAGSDLAENLAEAASSLGEVSFESGQTADLMERVSSSSSRAAKNTADLSGRTKDASANADRARRSFDGVANAVKAVDVSGLGDKLDKAGTQSDSFGNRLKRLAVDVATLRNIGDDSIPTLTRLFDRSKKSVDGVAASVKKTADGLEKVKATAPGAFDENGVKVMAESTRKLLDDLYDMKRSGDEVEKSVRRIGPALDDSIKFSDRLQFSLQKTRNAVKDVAVDLEKQQRLSIVAKLDADDTVLRTKIAAAEKNLNQLKTMGADILLTADTEPLYRELNEASARLQKLNAETATPKVEVKIEAENAKIAELEGRLQRFSEKDYTAEAKVKVDNANAELAALQLNLARLELQRHKINVDVDVDRGRVGKTLGFIQSAVSNTLTGLAKTAGVLGNILPGFLGSAFDGVSKSLGQVSGGIDSIGSSAKGVFSGLAGGIGSVLTTAISASLALAKLGALATGLSIVGAGITAAWGAAATAIAAVPAAIALVGAPIAAVMLGMDGIKKAAQTLKPEFDALKASVSDTFEKGLTPVFDKLSGLLTGTLKAGLNGVASSLVGIADGLVNVIVQADKAGTIGQIFTNVKAEIDDAKQGIEDIVSTFLKLAALRAPLDAITDAVNTFGDAFKRSVNDLLADGALDRAFTGLTGILGSLSRGFVSLVENGIRVFAGAAPGVTGFMNSLTNFFNKFDWERLGTAVGDVFAGLGETLDKISPETIEKITTGFEKIGKVFQDPAFQDGLVKLVDTLPTILGVVEKLAGFFGGLADNVGRFVDFLERLVLPPALQLLLDAFNGIDTQTGAVGGSGGIFGSMFGDMPEFPEFDLDGLKVDLENAIKDGIEAGFGGATGGLPVAFTDGIRDSISAAIKAGVTAGFTGLAVDGGGLIAAFANLMAQVNQTVLAGLATITLSFQTQLAGYVPLVTTALQPMIDAFTLAMANANLAVTNGILTITTTLQTGLLGLPAVVATALLSVNQTWIDNTLLWNTTLQTGLLTMQTSVTNAMVLVAAAFATGMVTVNTNITNGLLMVNATVTAQMAQMLLTVQTQMGLVTTAFTTGMLAAQTAVVNGMVQILLAFTQGLANSLVNVTASMSLITTAVQTGMLNIALAVQTGMTAITAAVQTGMLAVANAVVTGMNTMVAAVQNGMSTIGIAFLNGLSPVPGFFSGTWFQILSGQTGFLASFVSSMASGFQQAYTEVKGSLDRSVQAVTAGWGQIVSAVTAGVGRVVSAVGSMASQVLSKFGEMVSGAAAIGGNIISSLAGAISSGASRVISAAASVASQAISAAKAALGIASPSKEFGYLGDMSIAGFVRALSAGARDIVKTATAVADTAIDSFSGIEFAAPSLDSWTTEFADGITDLIAQAKRLQDAYSGLGASVSLPSGLVKAPVASLPQMAIAGAGGGPAVVNNVYYPVAERATDALDRLGRRQSAMGLFGQPR